MPLIYLYFRYITYGSSLLFGQMILELIKVMSWGFSLSLPASSSSHSQKCVFLVQDANKLQLSTWCLWRIKIFHIHLFKASYVDIHFPSSVKRVHIASSVFLKTSSYS